jgi:hypothetical protein
LQLLVLWQPRSGSAALYDRWALPSRFKRWVWFNSLLLKMFRPGFSLSACLMGEGSLASHNSCVVPSAPRQQRLIGSQMACQNYFGGCLLICCRKSFIYNDINNSPAVRSTGETLAKCSSVRMLPADFRKNEKKI